MFKFDENNIGSEPIKAGIYEVYADAYATSTSRNGNQMVQLNYHVREDVNQPSKGSEIRFDTFTYTENALWRFNALAHAIGTFPDGHDFGSMEGWAKAMLLKPVRVDVALEENNQGKSYPRVQSFKKTNVPQFSIQPEVQKPVQTQSKGFSGFEPPIKDDELPF